MNDLEVRIDELGRWFSKLQKQMLEQRANSEKRAADVIAATKGEIARLSAELRKNSAERKSRISEGLVKAQIAFSERQRAVHEKIMERKAKTEQERAMLAVYDSAEFAINTLDFAAIAIDKAILAFYEAVEQAEEYRKKYES